MTKCVNCGAQVLAELTDDEITSLALCVPEWAALPWEHAMVFAQAVLEGARRKAAGLPIATEELEKSARSWGRP